MERERPWLAGIQLMFAQIGQAEIRRRQWRGFRADGGRGQQTTSRSRYLETIAEQFALLAPDDRTLEMEEFESGLKDLRDVAAEFEPMVDAWSAGDQAKLDRLINGELDQFPEARKLLLDDRNQRWLPKIEAMLKEKHIFFITVGAGH